MSMPDHPPLNSEPLRQAVPSLRGYTSQIVRTTRAWADLKEGEVLYIEGAEDFDRVSQGGSAEAVQVRDVKGSITLATRKVLEALVHFWTHKRRNPGRLISYRYLTTAGRGRERDSRFGDNSGLDYWEKCRLPGTDLQPLRSFLAGQLEKLAKQEGKGDSEAQRESQAEWNATLADLLAFTRESLDEEFRDGLVHRMTWETGSPDTDEVLEDLARIVEERGSLLGARPSLARKAVPHLLLHVWQLACDDGVRALRLADFLNKLEESVDDVRVPLEELNRLRVAAGRSDISVLPAEPSSSSWYARVLRAYYTAAREAATAGQLKVADEQLRLLLDSVRQEAPAEDPERRRFEQGILLSRAQNALRSGNHIGAESLHREAAGIGPFENKNRHLAGWVLTNLGRSVEALEQLDPSDGTPAWESTLGIALIGAGRFDRFRELLGGDESQENPDVLLALAGHYIGAAQVVQAEHLARRLITQDDGTPETRFRAVEAAFGVFQFTISLPATPPVDAGEWLQLLRRLFSDSEEVMDRGVPLLRLLVLRRRIEFHELVSEGDEVAKDFRTLVENSPAMAAELAAFGVAAAREVDLMAAREGARDAIHAAIIGAVHFDTNEDASLLRLRELEPSAHGAEGEMLLVLLLELAAAQGEDPARLKARTGEISDPITRRIAEAGILRQANRWKEAMAVIRAALVEHPESLRLLRIAYGLSRTLGPSQEEVEFAERMLVRLPAPEFRLWLAGSRMRTGDVDGALRETAAVEEEGTRRAKAAYIGAEFALKARKMNEHAAAALRFFEAERSERGRLYAAVAALRTRQYGSAEQLYRGVLDSDDPTILLRAYSGLAHSIDAQGAGLPSAREQAVATLLEGYDRLGAPPELAGALYYRALGTRYEKDVHERIGRDFGSPTNLPGMIALPVEEGLEMIRREQEGTKVRIELLRAGVLPFETAVKLGHRRASYVWFAHRLERVLMIVEPPYSPTRTEDPILSDQPPPLLLDRTALLMLAETELLHRVLSSQLPLLIERETFDWLEEEEHSLQADGRPVQRQGLSELFKTIDQLPNVHMMQPTEIDEDLLLGFQESLSWGDSYELTSARREDLLIINDVVELDDVPEEERSRYYRSGDLLRALVASEIISIPDAAAAQEYRPHSFRARRGGSVPLDRPFLITHGALEAWHDCALLKPLSEGVNRLVVSPLAERHSREQLGEREADAMALARVAMLREFVVEAVDRGRVGLVGRESNESTDGEPKPTAGEEASRALLDGIAAALRNRYDQATAAGAVIWSDDPATRLYLDPLGPMISGSLELARLALSLRTAYPGLEVIGTSDVMVWLERVGILTYEERVDILHDVSAHGRALTGEAAVFAKAARARSTGSTKPSVLDVAEVMPSVLSLDVIRRFAPRVSNALAAAIVEVWFQEGVPEDERAKCVQGLLQTLGPWVAPSFPYARITAEYIWTSLVGELVQRLDSGTEVLFRSVLTFAASDPERFQHFLASSWTGIDVLCGATSEAPVEVKRLGARLVATLAVAGQGVELYGRSLLPPEMIRLAADLFSFESILTHTTTFERRPDTGGSHLFTVEDGTLEEAAASALNRLAEERPDPKPANAVPVEVHVMNNDGTVKAPIRDSVDVVRILGRLTPQARRLAVASLALYYSERRFPEIAESLASLIDDIASEEDSIADAAHRRLLTTFLESFRLWAEHDVHRAFLLLRDTPLEVLHRMAGDPEPWLAGETLTERVARIRGRPPTVEAFRAHWGPFEVAVDQWVALGGTPQAAETGNQDSVLTLIRIAVQADSGYDRVLALGTALALVQMRPDLGEVEIGELDLDFQGAPARLKFRGAARELLAELLVEWLKNEFAPAALEKFGDNVDRSDDALSIKGIATVHALLDRLTVDVERYVYRAVLSGRHDAKGASSAPDAEPGDFIGELLLLGHRLSSVMLAPMFRQARTRGLVVVIRDLEGAHEQHPLSQGRTPLREVFVPEVLGIGGQGINPLLVLLLTLLHRLVQRCPGDTGDTIADGSVPFWWTDAARSAIKALADRDPSPQLQYLRSLAQSEGVSDRFGSLLTLGVEGHAGALLGLLE